MSEYPNTTDRRRAGARAPRHRVQPEPVGTAGTRLPKVPGCFFRRDAENSAKVQLANRQARTPASRPLGPCPPCFPCDSTLCVVTARITRTPERRGMRGDEIYESQLRLSLTRQNSAACFSFSRRARADLQARPCTSIPLCSQHFTGGAHVRTLVLCERTFSRARARARERRVARVRRRGIAGPAVGTRAPS